ncbi:ABC transporter [Sulfolobus acidocaldarius SUSAZ]|nr:ABC transporter [Sulfolobus acidocaldarius SUSAZ]
MRNVIPTTRAIVKDNLSSRVTLGFVIFFPLILALVFSLLGNAFQPHATVYLTGENAQKVGKYVNASGLFTAYIGGSPSTVKYEPVIFINLTSKNVYYNQLEQEYVPLLQSYLNSYYTNQTSIFSSQLILTRNTPVAYEISGVIGVIALSNGIFGVTGVGSGYYRDRLVDRLASSPLRDYEWVLSLMIYEVLITILSSIVVLGLGLILGFTPVSILEFLGVLILSTLMFSGLGAIILGLTPKDKIFLANVVPTFIVFPLMFISNAFYSSSIFPSVLGLIARYQPVSIVNDVVRQAIVFNVLPDPIYLITIIILTMVFLGVGARLLKLREM